MRTADAIALAALSIWVFSSYLLFWPDQETATNLMIAGPDQSPQAHSLNHDGLIRINGALGPSTIQIETGKARFAASPCAGKHCLHAGWLSDSGDVAACLPNGVMIFLQGHDSRYDSINF